MSKMTVLLILLLAGAALFVVLLFTTTWWWYWNWLVALSVVTFAAYAVDKGQAALFKGRRIPNNVLHGLALAGGFPGAILGRAVFNHKSNVRRNPLFLIVLVASVLLHGAFIYWQLTLQA